MIFCVMAKWSACELNQCGWGLRGHTQSCTHAFSSPQPIYFSSMPIFLFKVETASLDQLCPFWAPHVPTKGWASFPLVHRKCWDSIILEEACKENPWNQCSQTWACLCKHLNKVLHFPFSSHRIKKKEIQCCKKHGPYLVFGPISRWVFSDSKFRFHCATWFLKRFQCDFRSAEI